LAVQRLPLFSPWHSQGETKVAVPAATDLANARALTKDTSRAGNRVWFTRPDPSSLSVCQKDFSTGDYSRSLTTLGLESFRGYGRRACLLGETSGNQLCAEPREFSLKRDSDFRLNWQRRADDPFHGSGQKNVELRTLSGCGKEIDIRIAPCSWAA
jgi:hypothetical protein